MMEKTRCKEISLVGALAVVFVLATWLLLVQSAIAEDAAVADAEPTEAVPEEVAADKEAEQVVELKSLSDEQKQALDETLVGIRDNSADIDRLDLRAKKATGLTREVLDTRLDSLFTATLEAAIGFAKQVADLRDDGYDVSAQTDAVLRLLNELPPAIAEAADRIQARVVMPDFSRPAAEQAAIDEQFFAAFSAHRKTSRALLETAKIADRFEVDNTKILNDLRGDIDDSAANASIFLDLSIAEVKKLRAGTIALPDDAELKAKLKVSEDRVRRTADLLESTLGLMKELELSTTQYRQQLLTATGAITASSLDFDVISGLLQDWSDVVIDALVEEGPGLLFQILLFVIIVYIFVKLANLVQRGINSALEANKQHMSHLLRQMISSISRNIVIIFGVLIALSQLGISLGPLLTGLGIAGFIVGFALQDSLSNFASGMMILFYRPFDVGDTIEAGGARGRVSSMSLVNTTIRTFDNQSLIIPNNKIWQDVITNVTDQRQRRVDMEFSITYDEDIDRVEKLLLDVIKADERVLDDPEPMIKVGSFGDSSVNILCRPWVETGDYWDVLWDMNKRVKQAFDREGITIPFPQRDVHLFQESAADDATQVSPLPGAPADPANNAPAFREDDKRV